MKRAKNLPHRSRQGSALLLSLIFIGVFSALVTAMSVLSNTNVQIAENHRKLDNARGCAESGLEVLRYWMNKVEMSGTTAPEDRFRTMAATFANELSAAGITNITPVCGSSTIAMSNVSLNASRHQSFSALLRNIDPNHVSLEVTGRYRTLTRTIRCNYAFGTRAHNVFDYGVATKGPLALSGNIEMTGSNIAIESNAYIETDNLLALSIIGNSQIAGVVKITNPLALVHLQGGQAGIGGATGAAAAQPPYTEYGYPETEFPEMVTSTFEPYVTSTLDPSMSTSSDVVLENVRIPAGMNPTFSGSATLRGVVWIEQPNQVTFRGNTAVCGVIVGNGSPMDNSGTNSITFGGSLSSQPVSQLPLEPKFEGIRDLSGTFVMAPGFKASFTGPFTTVSGAIAANGIEFSGNAGGTIHGSLINYSPNTMPCSGNNDLLFNRSGLTEVPAGFVPQTILHYDPASYAEGVQ
jgi:hypothetical protein